MRLRFFRNLGLAAAITMVLCGRQTQAQATPEFTASEIRLMQPNAAVRQILADDPWLVRRVLDDIARSGGRPFVAPDEAEAINNPQPRSSPEAAYDLFQLLKQAGADKQGRPAK